MALSKKFIWVTVNRDRTPAIPRRFNIFTYPTLMTIGTKDEKIHRFDSYKPPKQFIPQLEDALARYQLYRQGKEWDEPAPRPAVLTSTGTLTTIPAPRNDLPNGLAFCGDRLYFGGDRSILRLDPKSGAVLSKFRTPDTFTDLCSDGTHLYAVRYGWDRGKPIHVFDPNTGKQVREIVTRANSKNKYYATAGVTWVRGKLLVFSRRGPSLHELDPKTGDVLRTLKAPKGIQGRLAFDGRHVVASVEGDLALLDPSTGKIARRVPMNYALGGAAAVRKGELYLMEWPVWGYSKDHKRMIVWPREALIYKLRLPRKKRVF